jgi:hypothetical protein
MNLGAWGDIIGSEFAEIVRSPERVHRQSDME